MTKHNSLVLELNTDPEIIRFTHFQNSAAWKSKLTVEQYAEREWHIGCESKIGKRDTANNLGLFHFTLRDLSLPSDTKTSNIVASCETLNRLGWRIAPDSELKEIVAPCIGGVYTIPEHRGKGYAGQMITLLNEYWNERLDKDGFMFLYSEVGSYYEKFGYEDLEVPVHEITIPHDYTPSVENSAFHYLKYEEYQKLVDHRYASVKESLIAKAKKENKVLYSLIPSMDIYSWFHDRDLFISQKLHPELKVDHFGVAAGDDTYDHISWLHDWNDHHLTILSVSASSHERFKELFNYAIKEAQTYDMHSIVMWDTSLGNEQAYTDALKYIESFEGTKTFQKNGSISSIRALDGTTPDKFSWENNEKWCWF
ncbi:CYFA0S10e01706g1_1 [Cyberlindnera fabianii]|uniref:CYFA0S10e01706g1_1 n=1 Tax=Cyberlindnera fabianii TaxID=36022 RepID=A0A061B4Y6_CYBFA|nr:CYFA0S10e01706g1_1 [Cyberlindnera fabianii]